MIDISVLYCDLDSPSKPHRYGRAIGADVPEHQRMAVAKSADQRRPVVVWNITRTCNLACRHCYSDSEHRRYEGELTTEQAKVVLDDLAAFNVPAVLFSGGEPLIRPDIFELAHYARSRKLHVVFSTNGTLIDDAMAHKIKDLEASYVGVSLDSADPATHDYFRGQQGAFERTMRGFDALVAAGQKVGLRLTLSRPTCENLDAVFDLIEQRRINRACFYHLVPTGRGQSVTDVSLDQARQAVDTIISRTAGFHRQGWPAEILTVDNHCDGVYLYLRMLAEGDERAQDVYDMLAWNGGARYSSGVGIAAIDPLGNVHPDQFWTHYTLGNVKDSPFSQIWQDVTDPLLAGLRDRLGLLKGRCGACRFKDICGGSLRVRAELTTGDPWAADPGCYLTDEEIGIT